jgi:hypothetical protein
MSAELDTIYGRSTQFIDLSAKFFDSSPKFTVWCYDFSAGDEEQGRKGPMPPARRPRVSSRAPPPSSSGAAAEAGCPPSAVTPTSARLDQKQMSLSHSHKGIVQYGVEGWCTGWVRTCVGAFPHNAAIRGGKHLVANSTWQTPCWACRQRGGSAPFSSASW